MFALPSYCQETKKSSYRAGGNVCKFLKFENVQAHLYRFFKSMILLSSPLKWVAFGSSSEVFFFSIQFSFLALR